MAESNYAFTWLAPLEEDLEKLRGLDYEACAARVRKKGNSNILLKADESFQVELAATALGVPAADIRELPLKEYSYVLQTVFNFLFTPPDTETAGNSEA